MTDLVDFQANVAPKKIARLKNLREYRTEN